jgi:hypothetical protein
VSEKEYLVQNPRGIPKGSNILRFQPDKESPDPGEMWFEGDNFTKPKAMKPETVKVWVDRGFLKEV